MVGELIVEKVASWGLYVHDRLTSYLNFESVADDRVVIYRNIVSSSLLFACHRRWFQKILSNFELVMNFEKFG